MLLRNSSQEALHSSQLLKDLYLEQQLWFSQYINYALGDDIQAGGIQICCGRLVLKYFN